MDVHVELGSITFESAVGERTQVNECFLSRNLFRDHGPLLCEYKEEEGQELQEDCTSDGEEASKQAALRRYNLFQEEYRELLDPALEEEFEAMRQLGLPTMLINNYGDMEDSDSDRESSATPSHQFRASHAWHHPQWRNKNRQNHPHNRHQHNVVPATKGPTVKSPQPSPCAPQSADQTPELLPGDSRVEEEVEEKEEEEAEGKDKEEVEEREEGEVKEREEGEVEEGEVSEGDDPHSLELSEDDQWTSHSPQDQSGVDWGEVEAGYAAGMPGRWEIVEQDDLTSTQPEAPTSPTQELMGALKMKAQAFADQEWQQYWSSAGPTHLAWSWRQQYPGIPLTKVECLSGVDFLCQSLQTHMTLNATPDSLDQQMNLETRREEDVTCLSQSEHAASNEHEEVTVGASTAEEPREEGVAMPMYGGGGGGEEPSDREVLAMWNEFYNQHYWSHYSWFRGGQETVDISGEEEEEEEEEETLMDGSHDAAEQVSELLSDQNRDSMSTSHSVRTVEQCRSMGFSLAEKDDCNPHRRWVRVAALKLMHSTGRSHHRGGRPLLLEEAFSSVGSDGRLLRGRRRRKSRELRKRRWKKKKGKTCGRPTAAVGLESIKQPHTSQQQEVVTAAMMAGEEAEEEEQEEEETNMREEEEEEENMKDEEEEEEEEEEETMCEVAECPPEPSEESTGAATCCLAGTPLNLSALLPPVLTTPPPNLAKYWSQRYRIFSRYDHGIRMDEEGWFSATPEKIAAHIAERCRCDLIVDAFCGVGSNAIQFAFSCERVVAIDIDPVKIACARHNAELYGVADRIEFIVGDYFTLLPHMKCVDVVFLSPPWGGPNYNSTTVFSLHAMTPLDGFHVLEVARQVTPHIAYYLPRNIDVSELVSAVTDRESIEVEQHFLNRKLKTVTAYFGELVKEQQEEEEEEEY